MFTEQIIHLVLKLFYSTVKSGERSAAINHSEPRTHLRGRQGRGHVPILSMGKLRLRDIGNLLNTQN